MSDRKITKKEANLPVTCQLRRGSNYEYVIQAVLAVSPSHPKWCDVYWHVFEFALDPWKNSKHRVGGGDDHPAFDNKEIAEMAFAGVQRHYRGRYRVRLIARHEIIHEELIGG